MIAVDVNRVIEFTYLSEIKYNDPFNEVDFGAVFTSEDGKKWQVPGFWAGNNSWKVRFSSQFSGQYTCETWCSNEKDGGLHGKTDTVQITPYSGDNPLYIHGPLVVSENKRHFTHSDGTPFFWLGDTWWMGLTKRLGWNSGFQRLAIDRVEKGFSVIQIVAGLYPDMPAFDERGANEAGHPWNADFTSVNPEFFNYADRRIEYLVEMGLIPCLVGCWGYYLSFTGVEKMKQHWKYLIARWGAYPVIWCLAGEGKMAYYDSKTQKQDSKNQAQGWSEVGDFVRKTDPFQRLITIHPAVNSSSRNELDKIDNLDFEMLQTGHSDRYSLPGTVDCMVKAYGTEPPIPVLNAEVCYEGLGEACRQEVQRLMFWVSILSGGCGHTYGANGIWQVNEREKPYGPSPSGMSWGNTSWEDAYQFPGSQHLGVAKKILENYEWWKMEPHPEWIEPRWTKENYNMAYAAGIPGKLRIIYFPPSWWGSGTVKGIERDSNYAATLFNPSSGKRIDIGNVLPNNQGDWEIPLGCGEWRMMPEFRDWIIVLKSD